jgi:hypothetical protein
MVEACHHLSCGQSIRSDRVRFYLPETSSGLSYSLNGSLGRFLTQGLCSNGAATQLERK